MTNIISSPRRTPERSSEHKLRVLWKISRLDLTWPSARVRGMTPSMLLRRAGFDVALTDRSVTDEELQRHDIVVISKSFTDEDVALASRAKQFGKALVIDLCDDIFGEERSSQNAQRFKIQAGLADLVITTGDLLADIISRQISDPHKIVIVPDHAETLALMRELISEYPPSDPGQKRKIFGAGLLRKAWHRLIRREKPLTPHRKTVVWFGTTGLAGQGTGIEALSSIAPQLNAINDEIPLQVLIVTSGHGRVKQAAKAFSFPWAFRDWSLLSVFEHVAASDVCVLPNPPTSYARAKSANRALLALSARTPVIATASPAYDPLRGAIVIDDWHAGLMKYLKRPEAAQQDLASAQRIIEHDFSPEVVRDRWIGALELAYERASPART